MVRGTATSDSVSAQSRLRGITRTHDKVQYIADNSNSIAVNPKDTIILSFLFSTTHCSGSSYTCTQSFVCDQTAPETYEWTNQVRHISL